MQKIRPWLPPVIADVQIGVPAENPAVVSLAPPLGSAQSILEINADGEQLGEDFVGGYFNCCDVYVNVPADWADLTLRIRAMSSGAETTLDMRTLADMQGSLRPTGNISGQVFSIRGKPCSKFRIEAFKTAAAHTRGLVYGVAWGGPNGVYGDRATRLPVDLFAAPGQQRTFTAPTVPLIAGAPTVIFPASTTGDQIGITGFTWTRATVDAVSRILILQEVTPAAVVIPRREWILGAIGVIRETFTQPIFSARGSRWELVLSGGVALDNFVNVEAFDA